MTAKSDRIYPILSPYLIAGLACLAVTLAAWPLRTMLDLANIVMPFLFTVFLISLKLGRGPSVLAAFLCVGLFDFIFVPPHLGFIPTDAQYLITLAVMLAVALLTARLTIHLREQGELARSREQQTQRLLRLAQDLAGSASQWQVQEALDAYLLDTGLRGVLYPADGEGRVPGAAGTPLASHIEIALRGEPVEGEGALFLPLRTPSRIGGVMVVTRADGHPPSDERGLLFTLASLIGIAVERLHYVEMAQENQLQVASERLRNSILSALSHDLRTPLTALVGLAESLMLNREMAGGGDGEGIAATIHNQAKAMSHLLSNLLEMARLQSGKVRLRKEWQLFDDVIASSLRLLRPALAGHPVQVRLEPELPLVEFDAVLIERVVCNLLENAAKYSPAEAPIEVRAFLEGEHACLSVADRGPGFPPGRASELFEMFTRGNAESPEPGVGLGLAICRAILDAHGGTIRAEDREGGGACVTLALPLGHPPAIEIETEPLEGVAV